MTLPRSIEPGDVVLGRRRCSEPRFFLRPDPETCQVWISGSQRGRSLVPVRRAMGRGGAGRRGTAGGPGGLPRQGARHSAAVATARPRGSGDTGSLASEGMKRLRRTAHPWLILGGGASVTGCTGDRALAVGGGGDPAIEVRRSESTD